MILHQKGSYGIKPSSEAWESHNPGLAEVGMPGTGAEGGYGLGMHPKTPFERASGGH